MIAVAAAAGLGGCGSVPAEDTACPATTRQGIQLASSRQRTPQLALAADGTAAAVWVSSEGAPLGAATRDAGGAWHTTRLGAPGGESPRVVTADGRAVAVWDAAPDGLRVVQSATARGGRWSEVAALGVPGGVRPRDAALATGGGVTAVVWRGDPTAALLVRLRRGTDAWSPPIAIPARDGARTPRVGVDATGRVTVIWLQPGPGGRELMAVRLRDGRRTTPTVLSGGPGNASDPALAVAPDGHVAVAWRTEYGHRMQGAWLRTAAPDGAWGATADLGDRVEEPMGLPRPPGPISRVPALAAGDGGTVAVAWADRRDGVDRVRTLVRDRTGRIHGPEAIDSTGTSGQPALAITAGGTLVVVWEDLHGDRLSLRAAHRPAGAPGWTGCRTLTPARVEPAGPVLAAAGNRVLAAWVTSNHGGVQVMAVEGP